MEAQALALIDAGTPEKAWPLAEEIRVVRMSFNY